MTKPKVYKKKFGVENYDLLGRVAVSIGNDFESVWNGVYQQYVPEYTTLPNFNLKTAQKNLNDVVMFLDKLVLPKKAKFDFSVIGNHPNNGHEPPEKNFCGTAACAIGWMGVKKFKGLSPKWSKSWDHDPNSDYILNVLNNDGKENFAAAAAQLGISEKAAEWLFDPIHYRNETGNSGYDFEVTKEAVSERVKYARDYGVYFVNTDDC